MSNCPEYDRLHAQVESVLGNLAQVSTLLLELIRSKDLAGVHRLDKELELTVGEKERSLGALRQHVKEHKCVDLLQIQCSGKRVASGVKTR
ncbi:MAG TPA: hypothetical protein VKB49_14115 [Candidatus Sulfotelmatobacter sp.]|nr:hypothetical protein [Candidatus Sulfotelmatobacter sp.]